VNIESWEEILDRSITTPERLSEVFELDEKGLREVVSRYPMAINPYYLGLIKDPGDAIYRQALPDMREISDERGLEDPLNEEGLSPIPGLTHKYNDRVLFLISGRCPVYCRFCNRKRKVGQPSMVTKETIREGMRYIRGNRAIRDVLLSGGDPLLLQDRELYNILSELRAIPHVEIIRIGTRVPCTLPQRVTNELAGMLKGFHPLFVNTHFNHPAEITPQAALACTRLADAGVPLSCQTVLLKGVNDDPQVMETLMRKLLTVRVRPYYLFQADLAKGTAHFWTHLNKGLEIMSQLHGFISGLGVPKFMIDLPGGGGKIPMCPDYVQGIEGDDLLVKNYLGVTYRYPHKERPGDFLERSKMNPMSEEKDIHELNEKLGYTFKQPQLLARAFRHASYVNERPELGLEDNETFEFLGDAALDLAISHILMDLFQDASEGVLSKYRASVVDERGLCRVAKGLGLGDYLLLGRGEELTRGREKPSILANTMEALLGALYLDAGFDETKAIIHRLFLPLLIKIDFGKPGSDFKSLLQEYTQEAFKTRPEYILMDESGPDHNKTFSVALFLNGSKIGEGKGKSKKEAEQKAAREAFLCLKGD
jgi:lysine 2,3-aminomutase